jgi:hypothetical protein
MNGIGQGSQLKKNDTKEAQNNIFNTEMVVSYQSLNISLCRRITTEHTIIPPIK